MGLTAVLRTIAFAFVVTALNALQSTPARADWNALQAPGAIAIMRHAIAPGFGDPDNFRLDDCGTQRNLDDEGRRQARMIGQAFRDNGVEVDRVLTSQWCRSRETAELLGLAPVEDLPSLNSFFGDRSTAGAQTAETLAFLGSLDPRERVVLVSHQVNISALTGQGTASGEILVIDVGPAGSVEVLGEILIRP